MPKRVSRRALLVGVGGVVAGRRAFAGGPPPRLTSYTPTVTGKLTPQTILVIGSRLQAGLLPSLSVGTFGAVQDSGTISDVTPASFLWTVTLPMAGTVYLRVRNPDGKVSNSLTVTVMNAPIITITPTTGRGPQASITCAGGAVSIPAGSTAVSRQAIIDGQSPGTTYCLAAGTHTANARTRPQSGDTYVGQYGAIIDASGWVSADSTQGIFAAHNENIDNVTFRNLTLRNGPQKGIHAFRDFSSGWTIEYCEIDHNKDGVSLGSGTVQHCYLHHNIGDPTNGDAGLRGGNYVFNISGSPGTILLWDNEISYGGPEQKSIDVLSIIMRGNWAHHNYTVGLWVDGNGGVSPGSIIEDNIVEDQTVGIWYEAAFGAVIQNNTIRRHTEQGIFLSTSRDNEVTGNVLVGNGFGIHCYLDMDVVDATGSHPWLADLANNNIHGNTITTNGSGNYAGLFTWVRGSSVLASAPYTTNTKNNNWSNNTYHMDALGDADWIWETTKDWTAWQALPQDTTASGSTHVTP